jgi:hypothetical protein
MKRIVSLILACAALGALGGCTNAAIVTPAGFAELGSSGDYDYRAADARGVAIAVRRESNDPSGDLAFWSGALDAHLRRAGYVPIDATKVESADGVEGRQIRYHVLHDGREHLFVIAVYVTDGEVVTVEAGGDADFVKEQEKTLERAMASVTVS